MNKTIKCGNFGNLTTKGNPCQHAVAPPNTKCGSRHSVKRAASKPLNRSSKEILQRTNNPDIKEVKVNRTIIVTSAAKLNELKKRILKANTKAAKNGYGGYTLQSKVIDMTTDEELIAKFPQLAKRDALPTFPVYEVSIIGEPPTIEGDHEYIGILKLAGKDKDGKKLGKAMAYGDTEKLEDHMQNIDWSECDNCGQKRNRNRLLVLEAADGSTILVGGECAKKYLGQDFTINSYIKDSDDIAEILELEERPNGGRLGGSHSPEFHDPVFLMQLALVASNGGFVSISRSSPGNPSTSYLVHQMIDSTIETMIGEANEKGAFEDDIRTKATDIIDYISSLPDSEIRGNDYIQNLHTAATAETISSRNLGILVSGISMYERHLEDERKANEKQDKPESSSKYVGEIKERLKQMNLTITRIGEGIEGDFGMSYPVTMTDDQGNAFISFTGGKLSDQEEGDKIVASGTVKKHEYNDYNDEKQTHLGRVSFKPGGNMGVVLDVKASKASLKKALAELSDTATVNQIVDIYDSQQDTEWVRGTYQRLVETNKNYYKYHTIRDIVGGDSVELIENLDTTPDELAKIYEIHRGKDMDIMLYLAENPNLSDNTRASMIADAKAQNNEGLIRELTKYPSD